MLGLLLQSAQGAFPVADDRCGGQPHPVGRAEGLGLLPPEQRGVDGEQLAASRLVIGKPTPPIGSPPSPTPAGDWAALRPPIREPGQHPSVGCRQPSSGRGPDIRILAQS